MTRPRIARIALLTLNVRDLDRAASFYADALGFTVGSRTADRAYLALGSQHIELWREAGGELYPQPRAANDPWFQHFAIAVADMDLAYARLSRFSPEPITHGGPQLLPPSTGSVTAFKFRDPDGHPLELSYAPESDWSRGTTKDPSSLFVGIDHTALAVSDLEASVAFYTGLGFRVGVRLLNQGPEQARLDGLDEAVVDIVVLLTPDTGPHLELLHYRQPAPPAPRAIAPGDLAATRTTLAQPGGEVQGIDTEIQDPDGHRLRFSAS